MDNTIFNITFLYSFTFSHIHIYTHHTHLPIPFLSRGKHIGPLLYGLSAGVQSRLDPCPQRKNERLYLYHSPTDSLYTGISSAGGMVVQRVERWTCNQQVLGSNPTRGTSCVTTLGKLFTLMCLCHQAV